MLKAQKEILWKPPNQAAKKKNNGRIHLFFFKVMRKFLFQTLNGNWTFLGFFSLQWRVGHKLIPIQIAPSSNVIDTCHHLSKGTDKEHYLNVVNDLRVAAYSNPPLLPALVPLVRVSNFLHFVYYRFKVVYLCCILLL